MLYNIADVSRIRRVSSVFVVRAVLHLIGLAEDCATLQGCFGGLCVVATIEMAEGKSLTDPAASRGLRRTP